MFIAQAYEQIGWKWNSVENKLVECEPYLHNPCGTDYAMIMSDIKTKRGAVNRVLNRHWRRDTVEVRVFSYTNIFDERSYRLVATLPARTLKIMDM